MEESYTYIYKGKYYNIRFNLLNEKIKIFYNNSQYFSNYSLNDIIVKIKKEVTKINKFKDIISLTEKKKKLEKFNIITCLEKNITNHKLVFGASYADCLPSIWNIFPEDEQNKEDTFQINLYIHLNSYKLLLIRFNQNQNLINEIILNDNNDQNNNKIQEEINKIPNDFKISININNITELNGENYKQYNNNIYKKVFILQDITELNEDSINYIKKKYLEQLFIIICNPDNIKNIIEQRLNKILSDKKIKRYFDINNIIPLKDLKLSLSLSIIKIYLYFNQIDDYNLIDFIHKNNLLEQDIEGLKEEKEQIMNNEHFINIKICGASSTGKSTFINTILEEKRALAMPAVGTTKKSNIFISKKYHLKFIDDLGFNEGNEGEVNKEIENLKDKNHRIYIDENIDLSFGYNNDSRNNIHLFLYFFKYKANYNITQQHLSFVKEIDKKKIPIIFIINFCEENQIFEDIIKYEKYKNNPNYVNESNEYELLLDEIEIHMNDSEKNVNDDSKQYKFINKDYLKIPINCFEKKGFGYLFEKIYDKFKNNFVPEDKLKKLKNGAYNNNNKDDLKQLIKNNIFLKDIKIEDIISEQMKVSVVLIKSLILKLTGQYSGTLKPYIRFGFTRIWNYLANNIFIWRPSNEFFPLLTDLVYKIYKIFGKEEITLTDCNNYIRKSLFKYFEIDNNGDINYKNFKDDIKKNRYLFNNTENNFNKKFEEKLLEDKLSDINEDKFSNIGKFFLEQDKKFLEMNIKSMINNISINETNLNTNDDETKDEKMNLIDKEIEEKEEEKEEEEIKEKIEDDNSIIISNNIYENDFNDILERISNYIKKKFGIYNGENVVDNNNDKILLKIFLIEIVCKDLTYELCEKTHNVWDFFYNLAKEYNDPINGLKDLKEKFHT